MKILVSAFACDPTMGSEAGYGYNFAAELARQGHEVHCVTGPRGRQNIEDTQALPQSPLVKFHYVSLSPTLTKLYRSQAGMYLYYLLWQREAARKAVKIDKDIDFDLIHHITWGSLQLGSSMWRLGKPLFFGPVGGGQKAPEGFETYYGKSRKTEIARDLMSVALTHFNADHARTMKAASRIFVSNKDTFEMAKRSGAKDVAFLADATLPEKWFETKSHDFAPTGLKLLWVGRMMPRKGLRLTLESLAAVGDTADWSLTIVGDGELSHEIDAAIIELGLSDRVKRLGKVPWSEMIEQYRIHDMLIATPIRESLGVQLLEAMSSGLPILTLDLHGAAEFVPDSCGIRVPVTTPAAVISGIAQAVRTVAADKSGLPMMSKACLQTAAPHRWDQKVRAIVENYRAFLSGDLS